MDFSKQKVLIAYFSKTGENWYKNGLAQLPVGNTAQMASFIQKGTGGDLFEIVPLQAYPDGYYACCDAAKIEFKKKERPAIKSSKDIGPYDVIFIGYPTWFGTLPMPLFTWIEAQSWQGKIVIPFNTSEGSGFGKGVKDLQTSCVGAEVKEGLSLRGYKVASSEQEILAWTKSI